MAHAKRYIIVYEDDQIMVIDKPPGMLVIPTPKRETNTLTDLINRELDERGINVNAYPCHRLDRETSGLIIYAKGKAIQRAMMEEFRKRSVKKSYIAFVNGIMKKKFDTVTSCIYNRNKGRAEDAVTKYTVLEKRNVPCQRHGMVGHSLYQRHRVAGHFREMSKLIGEMSRLTFTVIEAQPVTGRTNQIRIHMKSIGHPLVGETVYAFRKDFKLRFKRAALHAKHIEFIHPASGKKMSFESPLAADMADFLKGSL